MFNNFISSYNISLTWVVYNHKNLTFRFYYFYYYVYNYARISTNIFTFLKTNILATHYFLCNPKTGYFVWVDIKKQTFHEGCLGYPIFTFYRFP